jgi:PAS domain S-box-containing protein
VEAAARVEDEDDTEPRASAPPDEQAVPEAIIRYVSRTGEQVVLHNATEERAFSNDPYVVAHQPQSILCFAIRYHGQVKRILYLENNLTTRAFTPERLELLGILASQAAVSLENATLYAEVQGSERKYRTIFENSQDVIFLSNHDGQLIEMNSAGLELFGYSREEIRDLNAAGLYADPEDRQLLLEALEQDGVVKNMEITGRRKDGTLIECLVTANLHHTEDREDFVLQGIIHDITAQKEAQRERERLILELEARNAELERFAYTISHELRSPLVTIKGFLGLLRQDVVQGEAARVETDLVRISEATDTMIRRLSELLELSKIGRVINPPESVSLTVLAQEAAALIDGPIQARRAEVVIAPEMPVVSGDRMRLLEVYQNLIENAVKFMGNQEAPRVEVGGHIGDAEAVCFVRDNGIGINPKYHNKVFELFDRLDVDSEGTGVGLTLVKRIVEFHGGRIWIESEGRGQGSTFYFTLPLPERPERTRDDGDTE